MADTKRRLPVLKASDEPEADDRSPWHWAVLGAVAIFVVWLPLAAGAASLGQRWLAAVDPASVSGALRARLVVVHALAFALACVAGGLLVRRYGARTKTREPFVSGVLAALIAWVLAVTQGASTAPLFSWIVLLVVVASIGGFAGALGGRIGLWLRPKTH